LSHYDRAIAIDPLVADAQFGYAMALVGLKRYREARDRLADGMKAHPDRTQFGRALARLLAAAPDRSVRDGEAALALVNDLLKKEQSADLGETMAMALAEVGQYDNAAAVQRNVIEAAERAGHTELAGRMRANLRLYEDGSPSRMPWRDDEMP
jgi:tetratricopeptide (TPR) repeat protein